MPITINGVKYCQGLSGGNVQDPSPVLTPCPGQFLGAPGAGGSGASNGPAIYSPYIPPPAFDPTGDPPPAGIVSLQFLAAPASIYVATVDPALLNLAGPMYYARSTTGSTGSWIWSTAGMVSPAGPLMWFQVANGIGYAFCRGGLFVQAQAGTGAWVRRASSPPNIMGGYVAPSGHILMTTNDASNLNTFVVPSGAQVAVWSSVDGGVTFQKIYAVAASAASLFDGIIAPFSDTTLVGLDLQARPSAWYEVTDSPTGFAWGSLNSGASAVFHVGSNDYFYGNGLQSVGTNNNYTGASLLGVNNGCIFTCNNQAYGGGTLAQAVAAPPSFATGPFYANNSNDPVEPYFSPWNSDEGGEGYGFFNSPPTVRSGAGFATSTVLGADASFSAVAFQTVAPGAIMGVNGSGDLYFSPSGAPLNGTPGATSFSQVGSGVLSVIYIPPIFGGLFVAGGFVIVSKGGTVQFSVTGATLLGKTSVPFIPFAVAYNDGAVFATGANGESAYSYDLLHWNSTASKTGPNDLPSAWGGFLS